MTSGPYYRSLDNWTNYWTGWNWTNLNSYSLDRKWYRQPKEQQWEGAPLPFVMETSKLTSVWGYVSLPNLRSFRPLFDFWDGDSVLKSQIATNRAYDKFKEKMWTTASVATTLAEWEQSCSMIAKRASQLTTFVKSLKRGRFGDAAAALQTSLFDKRRPRRDKHWADLFLELHFGWEPLVKDIGAAIEVLQGPPPPDHVRARGKYREETFVDPGGSSPLRKQNYTFTTEFGALIRVENPNLALANQMGFINPLSVAWELVPFSFVVDWFYPVGGFLQSFTDFCGMSVLSPRTTYRCLGECEYRFRSGPWPWEVADVGGFTISAFALQRTLEKPYMRPVFNEIKPPSLARAATQISLLIQQLHR